MPPRTIIPIQERRVGSHTVIPHNDSSWRPLHPRLEILALGDVIVEEVEDEVALLLLVTNDPAHELRVDEKSFLACYGVCSDKRVD